jgi:nucleotide-binding universal stress UspA family protein
MSIKRILLPVSNQDDITQTAEFAFALAEHHKAEVQGIYPQHNVWIEEWMDNWGLAEEEIEKLEEQATRKTKAAERQAEEAFKVQALRHKNVAAEFRSTLEYPVRSLLDFAIYADVTVLGNLTPGGSSHLKYLLNQMLSQSEKPLFVAPPRPADKNLGNRIVIAWNKSPEASRAVAAALPLISKASHVVIVSVGSDADRHSIDHLQDYLSLHAKNVETAVLDPNGKKTGQVLIDKTAEGPGSILVMGAYSHRRWREQVFGGVTDFVLNNTDVPALLMH